MTTSPKSTIGRSYGADNTTKSSTLRIPLKSKQKSPKTKARQERLWLSKEENIWLSKREIIEQLESGIEVYRSSNVDDVDGTVRDIDALRSMAAFRFAIRAIKTGSIA